MIHVLHIIWDDKDGAEPSSIFKNFQGRTFAIDTSTENFYGTDEPIIDRYRIVWEDIILTDDHGYVIRGFRDFDGEEGEPIDILLDTVVSVEYL
jgi:hypothetical protein